MGDFNINLLNFDDKNTANFLDTIVSYSYLPFINTLTRVRGSSKTLIDNIFHNKPMLNITAGNILIQPSLSNTKLEKTYKLQRSFENFDKTKFRNDLYKTNRKDHYNNPDSNMALKHFQQVIKKLLNKHAPYIMPKSHSFFTFKPLIILEIANSVKSKS